MASTYPQRDTEHVPARPLRTGSTPLSVTSARIASQWDSSRNGDWTPDTIAGKSNLYAWWRCANGHQWRARINNRTNSGKGCPDCGSLEGPAEDSPVANDQRGGETTLACERRDLSDQWHPTKNGDLTPADVKARSEKPVWWRHDECGYEWVASPASRSGYRVGCPRCSGRHLVPGVNDMATLFPEAAAQWHPTKNGDLTPAEVSGGSRKQYWFRCPEGHEWSAQARSWKGGRTGYAGCVVCRDEQRLARRGPRSSGRTYRRTRPVTRPIPELLASQWHPTRNADVWGGPAAASVGSQRSAWWQCPCGHEWEALIRFRMLHSTHARACPACGRRWDESVEGDQTASR